MDFTILWLMEIILIEHISLITTSSLSLKYQTCMSEKINGFHLYTGTQSITKSGYHCERWDALNPFHLISSAILATNITHRTLQNNYCRTMYPDEHPVPWCYTTDVSKEREECDIKMCSFDKNKDKYETCMGEKIDGYFSYTGTISKTKSGIQCQRWDEMKPHAVSDKLITLGHTFLRSQNNYCRTMYPNPDDKPWCYTLNSTISFEECEIPKCYFDENDDTPLLSRFKPYSTITTYEKKIYSNGIDDKNQIKFKTLMRQYMKWEIDLLQMSEIKHVKISSVHIKDYFIDDIRQIRIHIGDDKYNYWEQCTDFDGPGKNITRKHKFVCEGVARNIRVEVFHFGYIQLKDVDVFGYQLGKDPLLLYNKSALFISTSNDEESSTGVIGLIDTKFKPLLSWRNFWKVNLLKQYNISYLILIGVYTGQNYSHNILKIAVYIENKEQQNSTRCAYFEAPKEESRKKYIFICKGIGQYIRVEKSEFSRFQLQQVQVFGYTYDDNVLLSGNKPVSITPTYDDSETIVYGVDGGNGILIFNYSLGQNYAWEVNLLRMCKITYVLVSRIKKIRKISIYIGGHEHNNWDKCAVFESSAQNTKDTNLMKKHIFGCEGIGQYILVNVLHLGGFKYQDIKVFGIQYDDIMLLYNKSALFVNVYQHEKSSPSAERNFNTDFKTLLSWSNFWKVNLLKMFKIKYVILHNVYPVTQSANSNLTIAVYLENSKQKYSTRCAYYHGPQDKPRTLYRFICEAIGQYIRVEKSQFGRFKLQEIEVYGYLYYDKELFISQNKPTIMSSTFGNGYSSHYGVDGKRSTMFQTSLSQYNTWEVNILRMYKISYIILTTVENDSGGFRNISVYFGGKEHNNWEMCSYFDDPGEKTRKYYVTCEGIAQYIRLDKYYFDTFQLQEVEVFGLNIDEVILLSSNKPTLKNTRVGNDISVHGVDGDSNTFFKMTNNDNFNYWKVNLLKILKIKYVTFYLAHTEEYDFSDFQKIGIYVGPDEDVSWGVKCAYYDGPGEKSRTIYRIICEAIGNYVRIERHLDGHLKIQEIEVYGINNDAELLSRRKPTTMTHDTLEKQYASSHGADGKNDTIFKTASSTHNKWEVNLNRMCKISHVILTNDDIDIDNSNGFRNISVYLGYKTYGNWEKCGHFDGPGENSVKYSTACDGIAQYIRVVKSHSGHFQLQEVEVFGYYIDDVFLIPTYNKPTFMSSEVFHDDNPLHGLDGVPKGTKFQTAYHDHSNYWAVDLSELWNISYVSLHTVQYKENHHYFDLRNIYIYISEKKEMTNERCAYFGGPNDKSRTVYSFSCEGTGQFVQIVRKYKGYLELQEVEVYGKKPST